MSSITLSRTFKPALATLAATALGLTLTACGSSSGSDAAAASSDTSLLTYTGSDRDAKLAAAAAQEGALVVYTSNTATQAAAKEFGTMHPDIKVSTYLGKATDILTRLKSETAAHKVGGDFIGMADTDMPQAEAAGYLTPYFSPSVNEQPKDTVQPGSTDGTVLFATDREDYTVMGWNTKQITADEAPKTLDDLLNPKWQGKMSISGHTTGVNWLGTVLEAKGQSYVDQLKGQKIRVQDVTAAALADLVASGEVPLSPNLGLSDVLKLKAQGAAIDWAPIEPVPVAGGSDGVLVGSSHPAAALMFIDYLHSKQGQEFMVKQGVISPRTDVPTPGLSGVTWQSVDLSEKYNADQYAQKFDEWTNLMQQTFVG